MPINNGHQNNGIIYVRIKSYKIKINEWRNYERQLEICVGKGGPKTRAIPHKLITFVYTATT